MGTVFLGKEDAFFINRTPPEWDCLFVNLRINRTRIYAALDTGTMIQSNARV